MNGKREVTLAILCLLNLSISFGQGIISIHQKNPDFGNLKEVDSIAVLKFPFTNTGKSSIKITNIEIPCGCMKGEWSDSSIAPGKDGEFRIRFQTHNRPGPFEKEVTVINNGLPSKLKVKFTGMVEPKPKSIEEDFPEQLGALRFKSTKLSLGNITTRGPVERVFEIYNSSDNPVTFSDQKTPAHISLDFFESSIAAKSFGKFKVTYDPIAKNDFGYCKDVVSFVSSDSSTRKELELFCGIKEYFADTIDLALAPKLVLSKGAHDFGTIKPEQSDSTTFKLSNIGKQVLIVRKIQYNNELLACKLGNIEIKPGGSTELSVKLLPQSKNGRKSDGVILYVNDPVAPRHSLKITARVDN